MPDASQSLLERIQGAILHTFPDLRGVRISLGIDRSELAATACARAVMGVLGARDAEIRQHLETALSRSGTCIYGDVHPHIEAAFALLGDA